MLAVSSLAISCPLLGNDCCLVEAAALVSVPLISCLSQVDRSASRSLRLNRRVINVGTDLERSSTISSTPLSGAALLYSQLRLFQDHFDYVVENSHISTICNSIQFNSIQ
jgi:hypothetical protein